MTLLASNSAPFIGSSVFRLEDLSEGMPAILGCGYDGTTSFRPGTRRGPDALRQVSEDGIETYSPTQDRDLEDQVYADLGNLQIPYSAPENVVKTLYEATQQILTTGAKPIILGGEHSISPGAICAVFEKHPDLVVVQFDAHADLREEWNGTRHSHACAMRRTLDFLPAKRLLQVGIRSGTREEFTEMRQHQRLVAPIKKEFHQKLEEHKGAPIYVTFDIDIFDPQLVAGTGTPEPGGINWSCFEELQKCLADREIVGLDIVELAPSLDPSEVSSVVAAKLLREWILMLD